MFRKKECIYLGKITRTHGVRGQLVLATELPLKEETTKEPILIDLDGGLVPFFLDKKEGLKFRDHQSYLIRFDHVANKEEAECYVDTDTYLVKLPQIEEEEITQAPSLLKGFSVYDSKEGYQGKVNDIVDYSGNTLLSVLKEDAEILLPFTETHIISIDMDTQKVKLTIPEGLLDI